MWQLGMKSIARNNLPLIVDLQLTSDVLFFMNQNRFKVISIRSIPAT